MNKPKSRQAEMKAHTRREMAYEEAVYRLKEKRPVGQVICWLRRAYRTIHETEAFG
ncbi:MAG: hypothetical protein M3H12_02605 [Chromatiales bacterium]|nr:hypothetical protein [Gammaproteobacteria bacterium]